MIFAFIFQFQLVTHFAFTVDISQPLTPNFVSSPCTTKSK